MNNILRLPVFLVSISLLLFSCNKEDAIDAMETNDEVADAITPNFGAFTKELTIVSENGSNSITILIGTDNESYLAEFSEQDFGISILKQGEDLESYIQNTEDQNDESLDLDVDALSTGSSLSVREVSRIQTDDIKLMSLNILPRQGNNQRSTGLSSYVFYTPLGQPQTYNCIGIWRTSGINDVVKYFMEVITEDFDFLPVITDYGPNNQTCNTSINYSNGYTTLMPAGPSGGNVDGFYSFGVAAMADPNPAKVYEMTLSVLATSRSSFSYIFYTGTSSFLYGTPFPISATCNNYY